MLIRQRLFSATTVAVSFLSLFVSVFGMGSSGAQVAPTPADPYPNFTNSLMTSIGDPGAIYIPGANGVPGVYLGGETTPNGPFLIFKSANLEDLFFQTAGSTYNMSQYAATTPRTATTLPDNPSGTNGFIDPIDPATGAHLCSWGSPSFIVWKGVLYLNYGVGPAGQGSPSAAKNPCGGVSSVAAATELAGNSQDTNPYAGFISSPDLVMYNTVPTDPFCMTAHPGVTVADAQSNPNLPQVPQDTPPTAAGTATTPGNCWHAESYTLKNPFPGRAWSYLNRHSGSPNSELWGLYEDGGFNILRMQDPGKPLPDPQTSANVDPALAVIISYNVSNGITQPYNSLTPVEKANFRTFEFRHTKAGTQDKGFPGGVNEGEQGFTTKDKNGNEHVFANYSTNSALLGDYLMGLLTFTGSETDPLDGGAEDMNGNPVTGAPVPGQNRYSSLWTKSNQPAFQGQPAEPDVAPQLAYGYVDSNPVITSSYDPVCNPGTNSIIQIPTTNGNSELWDIYDGMADCHAAKTNQATNFSINAYSMNGPVDRTVRTQKIAVGDDGQPAFGNPAADGALLARPYGEDLTVPPYEMLVPNGNSATFDYSGAPQGSGPLPENSNKIFRVGAWDTTTVQNAITSNHTYGYLVITYQGSTIKLLGPTGNTCTAPPNNNGQTPQPSKCGEITLVADGDVSNPYPVDLSQITTGVLFDSSDSNSTLTGLQTGTQHTLKLSIVKPPNGPTLPVSLQSVVLNSASGNASGDVNGDGVVNCTDFDLVRASFGKSKGQPGYNSAADLNNDGVVNIQDLSAVSRNVPTGTRCH